MDYQKLLNESLIDFVKKVLTTVAQQESSDHHFYISFMTNDPDVELSPQVRQLYPQEITVVFQNQYENLTVMADAFSVKLSFNGIFEVIKVPFKCLISFTDPGANFSLQFKNYLSSNENVSLIADKSDTILQASKKPTLSKIAKMPDNVMFLDRFRYKNKPK